MARDLGAKDGMVMQREMGRGPTLVIFKNRLPAIPPRYDVVERPGKFNANAPRHHGRLRASMTFCRDLHTDPHTDPSLPRFSTYRSAILFRRRW